MPSARHQFALPFVLTALAAISCSQKPAPSSSLPATTAETAGTPSHAGDAAGGSSGTTLAGAASQTTGAAGQTAAGAAGRGQAGAPAAQAGAGDDDAGTASAPDAGTGLPRPMQPISPPVPDECITDVSAGDHTFSCGGLTFLVMVDDMCTHYACGLIFDIHGATMSGAQMRDNTLLYKIAPSHGYLVVNPSATPNNTGGTWDLTANPPTVADFMMRMIKAFHVDPDRVHVDGFSQGSIMTFWFLCNHNDLLASAAPVSGATDVSCLKDSWQPRVPIFYENGVNDRASTIDSARSMVMDIVTQLQLTGGMQIAGDADYFRKHWTGASGMEFDYIEHDYGGQAVLDGHCIPGGVDTPDMGKNNFALNATTCTTGMIAINWGQLALQWFLDHPRKH